MLGRLTDACSCAQVQVGRPGCLQVAFSSFTTVGPVMALAIAGDCLEQGSSHLCVTVCCPSRAAQSPGKPAARSAQHPGGHHRGGPCLCCNWQQVEGLGHCHSVGAVGAFWRPHRPAGDPPLPDAPQAAPAARVCWRYHGEPQGPVHSALRCRPALGLPAPASRALLSPSAVRVAAQARLMKHPACLAADGSVLCGAVARRQEVPSGPAPGPRCRHWHSAHDSDTLGWRLALRATMYSVVLRIDVRSQKQN